MTEKSQISGLKLSGRENVIMEIRNAVAEDPDIVIEFIERVLTYNTYAMTQIRKVYMNVMNDERSSAFYCDVMVYMSTMACRKDDLTIHRDLEGDRHVYSGDI